MLLLRPERLLPTHELSSFDCGKPALNEWLKQRALSSEGRTARTYVSCSGPRVVAYHCLAAGSVDRGAVPARLRRNTPAQLPVIVLGRLAVDRAFQGRGLGRGLVRDATLRTIEAAAAAGIRGLLVHALDDDARRFYDQFGFLACPVGERTLILPIDASTLEALGIPP